MSLWSVISSAHMSEASSTSQFDMLPTPYQLSILIGLCLASMEQLRAYVWYVCSPNRAIKTPPVLNKAGMVMLAALGISTAVFVSDTVLHYLTATVIIDQIEVSGVPQHESGRGLSEQCLSLDRLKDNGGFPCSLPAGQRFVDPNATASYNEISRLGANESSISQIRIAAVPDVPANVAIVLPNPETLDTNDDFRASTVGVATSCSLVPPSSCDMRVAGAGDLYTAFNCSDNFFGLLGKLPNSTLTEDGSKSDDSDLSPLAFKSSQNLQYAFFTDSNLSTIYNAEGWNATTNIPNFSGGLTDAQLLNPIHVGFAVQGYPPMFGTGSEVLASGLVYNNSDNIVAFVMSCSITTYEVDYVWHKSSLQSVTASQSPNGTLLEVFHGHQVYSTIAGAFDLQNNLVSAGLAGPKVSDYLGKWQDLYSVKVLSHIGGHLTPRANLQEQHRESSLVAQVPEGALGALIGFSLLYSVLGAVLVIAACRARNSQVSSIAVQLSLAGLTNIAFGDGKEKELSGSVTPHVVRSNSSGPGDSLGSDATRTESRRVRIDGSDFTVWV
jgi:hypothetical protein